MPHDSSCAFCCSTSTMPLTRPQHQQQLLLRLLRSLLPAQRGLAAVLSGGAAHSWGTQAALPLPQSREHAPWSSASHLGAPSHGGRATMATSASSSARAEQQQQQQQQRASDGGPGAQEQHPSRSSVSQRLLDLALQRVPELGFSAAALQAAARQLGLSPAVVGLLPRRESELVEEFIRRCNRHLALELEQRRQAGALDGLSTRERLALALRMRLSMLEPHMEAWPQALATLSQPSNLPHGVALLHALVDDVWALAAKDTSADATTAWYTRRAALAGVYVAAELHMLTDFSPGYQDTWQALGRWLEDMDGVRGALLEVQQAARSAWEQALTQARGRTTTGPAPKPHHDSHQAATAKATAS